MRTLKTLPLALFALVMLALAASPAGATPPSGYGFSGTPVAIAGGGSDTTYKAMLALSTLYNQSTGCAQLTAVNSSMGQCDPTFNAPAGQPIANFDHDVVSQAFGVGSGAGIASLNGFSTSSAVTYPSTVNPLPSYLTGTNATGNNVDFARSSRAPSTSGGNAADGNELHSDTFWGFAEDGVEVGVFDSRFNQTDAAAAGGISAAELVNIYNCTYHNWSDIPSLNITAGSAADGPIVVWGMNSSSGTYSTFRTFLRNNGAGSTFDINSASCATKLSSAGGGLFPLENDIKPLLNDVQANGITQGGGATAPAGLSTDHNSVANPANWIWWGSYGVFSSFPYTSNLTVSGTAHSIIPAPVNGVKPSTSKILAGTYPIGRTLYHVTRKPDADCPKTSGACDFVNNPGPTITGTTTDLNVVNTGGTAVGHAVQEFTRWLCRKNATQQAIDPFTGTNEATAISGAISGAGFTAVPSSLRANGSSCQVLT